MKRLRCYLLDATALIQGLDPAALDGEVYTVPQVIREAELERVAAMRIETAMGSERLRAVEPSREFLRAARSAADEAGERQALSDADIGLVAMGLQLRSEGREVTILSDDYSVQNLAAALGIRFKPLAAAGIKLLFKWRLYCPACRKLHPPKADLLCARCGGPLRRRVVKSKGVQRP